MSSLETVTNEAMKKHQPMVRMLVSRLIAKLPANIERDDLFQVGMLAIATNLQRFDKAKVNPDQPTLDNEDAALERFLNPRVHGAMLDYLRHLDFVPRGTRRRSKQISSIQDSMRHCGIPATDEAVAKRLGITVREVRECIPQYVGEDALALEVAGGRHALNSQVEQAIIDKQQAAHLDLALKALPERMQKFVELYYFRRVLLKTIGKEYGITESAVCLSLRKAVDRLTKHVRMLEGGPPRVQSAIDVAANDASGAAAETAASLSCCVPKQNDEAAKRSSNLYELKPRGISSGSTEQVATDWVVVNNDTRWG